MVAEITGRTPAVDGSSTRSTLPEQTRSHGSETGMRKTISIGL